jgi:hypothetical protein
VSAFDLAFRPASYWDHPDAVTAIRSRITGQNRRRMVTDFVTGAVPAELGEIDAGLLADALDDPDRRRLGAIHPSWLGGEYLPGYLPGEVEIARIVLASVTQDVISIRARRRRAGSGLRIRYRMVDDYDEPGGPRWSCRPASSAHPLALGRLIRLIDDARRPDLDLGDGPLADQFRDGNLAGDPEPLLRFVTVESDSYPTLAAWYRAQAEEWLRRRRRDLDS